MNKDTYSGLRFPLRQGKRAVLREAAYFGCPNKLSSRFSHAHVTRLRSSKFLHLAHALHTRANFLVT